MAKLQKHAQVISDLHDLVMKRAEAADKVTGKPGADTKIEALSDDTETTSKNDVGPEKLNDKQDFKQKPSDDKSEPSVATKSAEDLAQDLLDTVKAKLAEDAQTEKKALAQTGIGGVPGKELDAESLPDSTETTNKNDVGPEKLNDEQGYKQKPATHKSEPSKAQKTAEEIQEIAAKIASFELGAQFAQQFLSQAPQQKQASAVTPEMLKEAGRHDFDAMIAQAAAELETQQAWEKQAEDAGAAAFDELLKEAQIAMIIEENTALKTKLAEYEQYAQAQQAEVEKTAAAQREEMFAAKVAELAAKQAAEVILSTLKREAAPATESK